MSFGKLLTLGGKRDRACLELYKTCQKLTQYTMCIKIMIVPRKVRPHISVIYYIIIYQQKAIVMNFTKMDKRVKSYLRRTI